MDDKTIQAKRREIGNAIKALRNDAGLTQNGFGKKVGLHNSHISKYETGRRIPSRVELERILERINQIIIEPSSIDIQDFLAKLGLSEEEYDWIRKWKVQQPDIGAQLHEARTVNDINQ
jgi:transcriptional regulator with XRE-family HTH domain